MPLASYYVYILYSASKDVYYKDVTSDLTVNLRNFGHDII